MLLLSLINRIYQKLYIGIFNFLSYTVNNTDQGILDTIDKVSVMKYNDFN